MTIVIKHMSTTQGESRLSRTKHGSLSRDVDQTPAQAPMQLDYPQYLCWY